MVEAVWGRLLPISRRDHRDPGQWLRWLLRVVAILRWAAAPRDMFSSGLGDHDRGPDLIPAVPFAVTLGGGHEIHGSARPQRGHPLPRSGPYDERLGYAQLPAFIEALSARHFVVTQQARWSPPLERFVDQGGYRSTARNRGPG